MPSTVETIETAEDRAITALFAEIRTELGVPTEHTCVICGRSQLECPCDFSDTQIARTDRWIA